MCWLLWLVGVRKWVMLKGMVLLLSPALSQLQRCHLQVQVQRQLLLSHPCCQGLFLQAPEQLNPQGCLHWQVLMKVLTS
jgi:hypothetical protein